MIIMKKLVWIYFKIINVINIIQIKKKKILIINFPNQEMNLKINYIAI